jgi:hypothetical protein
VDVLLLGFISGLIYAGFRTGFIRRLVGLGFLALSFVLGAYVRVPVGALISASFKVPQSYGELVAYTFIFPAVIVAANVIAHPLLARVAVSGLSREADQVLGAIFGGIEAVLIISAAVVILDTYSTATVGLPSGSGLGVLASFKRDLDATTTVHILRDTTVPVVLAILGPFLPKDVSGALPGGIPSVPGLPNLPLPTARPSPTR